MYKSWGNSAYSPKGTLTFDFSDLDYLEPKDKAVKQALKNTDSDLFGLNADFNTINSLTSN